MLFTHTVSRCPPQEKLKGKWGNFTGHLCARHELCSLNTHPTPARAAQLARSKSQCFTQLFASDGVKVEIALIKLTFQKSVLKQTLSWYSLCLWYSISGMTVDELEATTWTHWVTTCWFGMSSHNEPLWRSPRRLDMALTFWHFPRMTRFRLSLHLQVTLSVHQQGSGPQLWIAAAAPVETWPYCWWFRHPAISSWYDKY